MPKINEATDTDLKVIERLQQLGWKRTDTFLYQREYALSPEHQKMLVHMATSLGKTRTMVALAKALLQHNMARHVSFVVDRISLAEQALKDGFHLINNEFSSVRITSSNVQQHKHASIHVVVIDTLENIYQDIPGTFYDLLIVDNPVRARLFGSDYEEINKKPDLKVRVMLLVEDEETDWNNFAMS